MEESKPYKFKGEKTSSVSSYIDDLRTWVNDAYQWYSVNSLLYMVFYQQSLLYHSQLNSSSNNRLQNNSGSVANISSWNSMRWNIFSLLNQNSASVQETRREFRIPPIWRRCAAEIIDYSLLFSIKLFIISFLGIDPMSGFEKYKKSVANPKDDEDFQNLMDLTYDIFIFEILIPGGGPGGATFGKAFMGIRIVSFCNLFPGAGRNVFVTQPQDLGWTKAFIRSVLKHFNPILFLPMSTTFMFFTYNRPIYDIICGSLVVEDIQPG